MQALSRRGQAGPCVVVESAAGEGVKPRVAHLVEFVTDDGVPHGSEVGAQLVLPARARNKGMKDAACRRR